MSADFQAVKAVFLNAVEKADAAERAGYLDQACGGDADLRQHVEALLQAHEASGNILDAPAAATAETLPPRPDSTGPSAAAYEQVGQVIAGKYKLVQKLGEGGMGSVWVAEQTQPIKRRVALKMIRSGFGSHLVLRRFEAERQALALMDYPNIAKILDGGETPDGRPFFVMELVKGVPITRYCDELHLSIRERLELFVPVCRAIQHAHQKGIIHRDIKPMNVLVAIQDGVAVPKVIDFGVAKALNQRLTAETMNTQIGAVVGTLEYMSPEQAELSELDIDTRADVYALGVLLYELLTGTTPLNRSQLKDAAIFEMLRIIKQDETPKPSTRLSESKESLPGIAAQRHTDPGRLAKEVRGELDWIVMKCLEKNRVRRYESASALARDIERFLGNEPVEASPPSTAYRLSKFVRRNRAPVAAAAVIVLALVAGVATSSWQAIRARRAETSVRKEAENAEAARLAEAAQRQRADQQRNVAEENRVVASRARDEAENALYFNRINLAHQYWISDNLTQSSRILDACPIRTRGWDWHYLDRLNHEELLTLPEKPQFTDKLQFSKDGKRLAAFGKYGYVGARIWELSTNRPVAQVNYRSQNRQPFSCGALSPDGKTIALGERTGAIGFWDADTGKFIREFSRLSGRIASLSFSPDGRSLAAARSRDFEQETLLSGTTVEMVVWNLESGNVLFRPSGYGVGAEFSPDGSRLLTLKRDALHWLPGSRPEYTFALFDTSTWTEVAAGKLGSGTSISFSGDGKRLALGGAGAQDKTYFVRVVDPATGNDILTLSPSAGGNIALSPDGTTLAVYGQHRSSAIEVWDLKNTRRTGTLRGHTDGLQDVVFAPDGRLASCSMNGSIKFWDPSAAQVPRQLAAVTRTRATSPEAFGPGGTLLAYADVRTVNAYRAVARTVSLVDAGSGQLIRTLPGHEGGTLVLAFSQDGTRVATGGLTGDEKLLARANSRGNASRRAAIDLAGEVKVYDIASGALVSTFHGHDGWVKALALSPDGRWAASAQMSRELAAGSSLPQSEQDPSLITKDWSKILATVKVWEVQTGRERFALTGHVEFVSNVAFSPDGRLLASADRRHIKIWDLATGMQIQELNSDYSLSVPGGDLVFSPSSDLLISAGGKVQVWDVGTGRSVAVCYGGFGSVAINPDQSRLARCSGNNEVKLWDLKSGQEALTLSYPAVDANRPAASSYPLAWSSDGHRLRAALPDGSVVEWDGTPRSEH